MKVQLLNSEIKTKENSISENETKLNFTPFISNIIGLQLILHNANGIQNNVPISDTNFKISDIDISNYGFFWLEYKSADKNYEIEFQIK